MAAAIATPMADTTGGYTPQVVTLCNFGFLSAADLLLLELYPSWRHAMAEWDGVYDRLEETDYPGYALRRRVASINCELRAIEAQIASVKGNGPAGAIVKLAVLRTMTRSGTTTPAHVMADEAIALLARSAGLEPYDYREGVRS